MTRINEPEIEVTGEEFENLIEDPENLVVANFFSEFNLSCLMLTPIIQELSSRIKNVKFIKINVDENEELARKYKVNSFPCIILFRNGTALEKMNGSQIEYELESKIEEYASLEIKKEQGVS